MEADADVGEPAVDVGTGVVEPAACGDRQPLGEPADGGVVGEPQSGALQAGAAVHPDRCGAADEDVGGARVAQQLVERARAGELLAQRAQGGQDVEIRRHPAGLRPHRCGDRGRIGVAARGGQSGAHAIDEADRRRAHGALRWPPR